MIVHTESGTIYEVDLAAMQVRRVLAGDARGLRHFGEVFFLFDMGAVGE